MHEDSFRDKDGKVHMCKECKQVLNQTDHEWVIYTNWYSEPPKETEWGTCPRCSKVSD